ncbi:MAG: hypothetical protein JST00_05265 [Deltaproteobacteria bacterium]|nr:hypothetical protein [Deltaproteobacteria bacterium]
MVDRCGGVASSRAGRSYAENSCDPGAEEAENRKQEIASSQAEADARRDEWIGGASEDASSRMARTSPTCDGPTREDILWNQNITSAIYSRGLDRPLEDDPLGNAIPGLVAGGIVSSGRALASSTLPNLGKHAATNLAHESGRIAKQVGSHALEHAGSEAAMHIVHAFAHSTTRGQMPIAQNRATPPSASAAPSSGAAGRSGANAVSEPAHDPAEGGKSDAALPAGRDAVPYRPGQALPRIPEAVPDVVVFSG